MHKGKNLTGGTYNGLDLLLTLSRDFAGIFDYIKDVIWLELGKEVWKIVSMKQQGCHANYFN